MPMGNSKYDHNGELASARMLGQQFPKKCDEIKLS
jgi:hypothetical protein